MAGLRRRLGAAPAGSELAKGAWPAEDADFVEHCYTQVLGRVPDAVEREHLLARLAALGRGGFLAELLAGEQHRALITPPKFVPPGHFYSPIPSDEEIAAHAEFDWGAEALAGIDLRAEAQLELLERFAAGYADIPFTAQPTDGLRYHYENPNYSYADAIFLVSMLRELRPRRFIEVGSGDSSCALLDANDRFFEGSLELTFIEPYADYLRSLLSAEEAQRLRLLESRLQDVPLEEFERLQAGDVLFIDSTHVSKLGSDVNHLLFEILPRLAPGVHVHIHDVFWPFEYPHHWLAEGRAWNEQYVAARVPPVQQRVRDRPLQQLGGQPAQRVVRRADAAVPAQPGRFAVVAQGQQQHRVGER